MANLPKVADCPLRDNESNPQICMCLCSRCDMVDLNVCFAIRNSFQYGHSVAESKYLKEIKMICSDIAKRVESLDQEE